MSLTVFPVATAGAIFHPRNLQSINKTASSKEDYSHQRSIPSRNPSTNTKRFILNNLIKPIFFPETLPRNLIRPSRIICHISHQPLFLPHIQRIPYLHLKASTQAGMSTCFISAGSIPIHNGSRCTNCSARSSSKSANFNMHFARWAPV